MNSFLWKCERECQVGNAHDAACRDSSISLCMSVCVWLSIRQQQQQLLHCCTVVVVCLPVWLAVWQMPTLLGILQFARQMCPQSICVASGKRNAERKAQCCHCGCCLCSWCCCCCCCLCFCLCFVFCLCIWLNSSGIMHEYSCDFILLNETLCRAYKCQPIDSVCVCVWVCVSVAAQV